MDISNLNKIELLEKCKELGIINCRSKSKLNVTLVSAYLSPFEKPRIKK